MITKNNIPHHYHRFSKNTSHSLLVLAVLLFGTFNAASQAPPSAVAGSYSSSIDWSVSDNFSTLDWNKWTYRKDNGSNGIGEGSQYVYIVNNSFVSLRGSGSAKKGGGLSGLRTSTYGFYVTKFRLIGFPGSNSTAWHPAIWSSPFNLGVDDRRVSPLDPDWNEIDLMEFIETGYWHTQFAPRRNNQLEPPSGRPQLYRNESGFDAWRTLGLEYNPTYQQLWEYVNGSWRQIGNRIYTSGFENTTRKIYYKCLPAPQYWVLSNKYNADWGFYQGDSWMHVDFFHYYPYNSGSPGARTATSLLDQDVEPGEAMEYGGLASLSLVPNPVVSHLMFNGIKDGNYTIEVSDLQGKLVINTQIDITANRGRLKVADLTDGVYILKIGDGTTTKSFRFIKN